MSMISRVMGIVAPDSLPQSGCRGSITMRKGILAMIEITHHATRTAATGIWTQGADR
jgi:hypothetical protein